MLGLMMAAAFGLLAMTGCKGGGSEIVKEAEALADKTCACKDVACLQGLQAESQAFGTKLAGAKASAEDQQKIAAAGAKMTECATKLATQAPAGEAPAAPAGEAPAAPAGEAPAAPAGEAPAEGGE